MDRFLQITEHPAERVIRVVLGLFVLSLLFWGPQSWFALLGLVPLATGITGRCPLYSLFGFSTCRMKQSET